eukprot:Skav205234  [mRNA]  locus=scaffold1794:149103:155795:- [translate_table: standard]
MRSREKEAGTCRGLEVRRRPKEIFQSRTSQKWWQETLKQARKWYSDHMELSPLDRIAHEAEPSDTLKIPKWVRLERRASNMLLAAVPDAQREELVSTKRLTVLQILCHLLMVYQPGGLAEKEVILSSLENPPEGGTIAESLQGLRRWMRWRRRAAELAVSEPDPFLLLKGLGKIVRRPLEGNKELNFRVSLARSNLQVDSNPTSKKVNALAIHLVAELEQVAHLDQGGPARKNPPKDPGGPPRGEPRVKKIEATEEDKGGKAEGKGKNGKGNPAEPCKFFLLEGGCKKGKDCTWAHQLDDQKRCWNCGAKDHYADKCQRPSYRKNDPKEGREGKGDGRYANARTLKKRDSEEEGSTKSLSSTEKAKSGKNGEEEGEKDQTMKELLEEATKMLKKMSKEDGAGREDKLTNLQKQLDDLKTIKTLRLARFQGGPKGLLDSGATHPLRARQEGERMKGYKEVTVSLAGGKEIKLNINKQGVMVSKDPDIEPIVPLGMLISLLGCEVSWKEEEMVVWHPVRGRLEVQVRGGCPEVEKDEALRLIEEIEEKKKIGLKRVEELETSEDEKHEREKEKEWLRKLIEVHPAFRQVPEELKAYLYEDPSETVHACGNRRRRKLWKKEGVVIHLYAGAPEGFGLGRAVQQAGGDSRKLLEVDWERDEKLNMLPGGKAYGMLLRLAMNGWVNGVVGGPNCRTRSVLRHVPLSPEEHGPRPLRSWEDGQEWGRKDLTPSEAEKVKQDDILMLRFLLIYIIAEELRKAEGRSKKVHFLLEQPGIPKNKEVVSWWQTDVWKKMKKTYRFDEVSVDQWDWGGAASKWTTLGTSMKIERPLRRGGAPKRDREGKDSKQLFQESRALARWAPGLMIEVAERLQEEVWEEKIQCRPLSWSEHVRAGHVPFRRDCRICQESRAKGQPHRRVTCPKVGVLSIDMSGPLKEGKNLNDEKDKFLWIATFTWPKLEGRELKEDPEVRLDDAPHIEVDVEEKEPEDQVIFPDAGEEEKQEEEGDSGEKEGGEDDDEESLKKVDVEVHRMGMALPSKSADDVLRMTIQIYLRLKSEGFEVQQIHTDRGAEFDNPKFKRWCEQRCILKTWTPGDDPQSNGRCERAVQEAKGQIRTMLLEAGLEADYWPLAARHLNERWMAQLVKEEIRWPPFMTKVLVRKRGWRVREFEPSQEQVTYMFPSWDSHGHWIVDAQGRQRLSRTVMSHFTEPITEDKWIALEDDENPIQMRRRLRQKMVVRRIVKKKIEEEEEESQRKKKKRVQEVLREEMTHIMEDEEETAKMMLKETWKLKRMTEEEKVDEVLQTRIVSMAEIRRNSEAWKQSIMAELNSLFHVKKALRKLTKEEVKRVKEDPLIEVIPSKLVCTLKPDPQCPKGRKKSRIVACGNYIPTGDNKDKGDLFAAGSDAIAVRLAIREASRLNWSGTVLDIKTAFLNAPIVFDEEKEAKVLIKPPGLLVGLGLAEGDELWEAIMALYGFRESPRRWSDFRDMMMRRMEAMTPDGGKWNLEALTSEPNLWKIKSTKDGRVGGMIVVYIDDLLIIGEEEVKEAMISEVKKLWETSVPEEIDEKAGVRFLGMELWKLKSGDWMATQQGYIREMLRKNLQEEEEEWRKKKVPMVKAWMERPEEEVKSPGDVKEAQRVVGEVMWIMTRTRPDLLHTTSTLASQILKKPKAVKEAAEQLWAYLASTWHEGLIFKKEVEDHELRSYTDASFGEDCFGCTIVMLDGAPIAWKAGKQHAVALSTAEAELTEILESLTLGDSIRVVAEEMREEEETMLRCVAMTDNQAATTILSDPHGSWRTRYLRMKAKNARWRIQKGDWQVMHVPGAGMPADMGTKPVSAQRLEELKKLAGMRSIRDPEGRNEEKKEEQKEEEEVGNGRKEVKKEELERLLQMIVVATSLSMAKGQEGEEDEKEEGRGYEMIVVLMLAVWGCVSALWSMGKGIQRRMRGWKKKEDADPHPKNEDPVPKEAVDPHEEKEMRKEMPKEDEEEAMTPMSYPSSKAKSRPIPEPKNPGNRVLSSQAASSHEDPKGKARKRKEVMTGEGAGEVDREGTKGSAKEKTNKIPQDVPPESSQRRPRFQVLVTDWGIRYHVNPKCSSLANSRSLVFSPWCPNCASSDVVYGTKLKIKGPGYPAHVNGRCGEGKWYQACSNCSIPSEKPTA